MCPHLRAALGVHEPRWRPELGGHGGAVQHHAALNIRLGDAVSKGAAALASWLLRAGAPAAPASRDDELGARARIARLLLPTGTNNEATIATGASPPASHAGAWPGQPANVAREGACCAVGGVQPLGRWRTVKAHFDEK